MIRHAESKDDAEEKTETISHKLEKMKTAVYFDLDGTLITYGKDFENLFEEALGFEVDEEVHQYWTKQILENLEKMEENPYLKALRMVEEKFELGIDPRQKAEKYIEIEVGSTEKYSKMVSVMEKLSNTNKIGIMSNGDGKVQMKKIQEHGLDKIADEIIISNSEGFRKPDKQIFQLAKQKLDAENYIYIGDTHDEDIIPAKDNGFKTVYVSGEREADLETRSPEKLGEVLEMII